MQYYNEPARRIPVSYDVDVLVVGAGPAGIGAAVRAGRMGVRTMLIEAQGCVGGIATAGMMSHWGGRSSSGVFAEIIRRSSELHEDLQDRQFAGVSTTVINHETLKNQLLEMLKDAHVEVLLYTFACGTAVEDGTLKGVIIENKTGRSMIRAKAVVDASGDGDVAAHAGVPFTLGRESDHMMQPCTVMFKVGGVDYTRAVFPGSFETQVQTPKGELQALAARLLPFPAGHVLLYETTLPGVVCCNMTNCIHIDGTSAESLTEGTAVCASQMRPIVEFLREYVPGYEACYLLCSAQLIGIRETRHFQGRARLEKEDILKARLFEDWVVREAFFNFDVHNLTGPSLDKTGVQEKWAQPDTYSIAYGSLLPANVEGLLLSGRNISGSHIAHSNFRIMTVCMAIGEASGAAAALGCLRGCRLCEVPPAEIQRAVS